jgi:hypothetical protein
MSRRGGRAVECGGLENRCAVYSTGGSNPPLSASESQESCVETRPSRPGLASFRRVRGQFGGKLNNTHQQMAPADGRGRLDRLSNLSCGRELPVRRHGSVGRNETTLGQVFSLFLSAIFSRATWAASRRGHLSSRAGISSFWSMSTTKGSLLEIQSRVSTALVSPI